MLWQLNQEYIIKQMKMIENAVTVQIMLKMNFILYWFVQNIITIGSVFLRNFILQRKAF